MEYPPLEIRETSRRQAGSEASQCSACTARNKSFCGAIPDDGLSELRRSRRLIRYSKSQMIISAGQPATHIYNVVSGFVKLYRTAIDGRTQIIGIRTCGEFFATADADVHASSAEALTRVQVCSFSKLLLNKLLTRHPEAQAWMLKKSYAQLADSEEQMFLLGRKTARERVASFLLRYGYKISHQAKSDEYYDDIPLSRGDIANFLGLTVETVSRVLTDFAQKKIIVRGQCRTLRLIDIRALKIISEHDPYIAEPDSDKSRNVKMVVAGR